MWFKVLLQAWIARRTTREMAAQMYEMIVQKAREPVLFEMVNLPDNPQGRFESIVLHMFLVQRRFRDMENSGSLPQKLMDSMADDFDRSIREMGVGDLSVGKNVKKLLQAVRRRFTCYDVHADDDVGLKRALENVFQTGAMTERTIDLQKFAIYVKIVMQGLSNCSDQALREGRLQLPLITEGDLSENV